MHLNIETLITLNIGKAKNFLKQAAKYTLLEGKLSKIESVFYMLQGNMKLS